MRLPILIVFSAACTASALAQSNWDRTYNVSAKPAVQIDVDDASVRVHSCGDCRAVRIHVDPKGGDLSRWRVTEMQGGNGIHFALKHKEDRSLFVGWHGHAPEVMVETPAETDLNVHSADGSLAVAGLRGSIDLKTGDGSVATEDTAGPLRVSTGDGSVQVHRAEGTLSAGTGDGSMQIEGRFTQLEAHTGDGSINLALLPGSNLQSSSRVTTGDGSIALTLPRDLRADVQASTGDGSIANGLNMQTSSNDRHNVHGLMNGGGPTLRVHSGDGSISMSAR
ncbi:MAG: DUF4097 family beta strand repeat-containing protein [Janthinobacterium lividum]